MMSSILSFLFLACALVCFLNVRRLWIDKTVKGVSLIPTLVFITTNLFEVAYFGLAHDWLPVMGALAMLIANVAWLVLAVFYDFNEFVERAFSLDF